MSLQRSNQNRNGNEIAHAIRAWQRSGSLYESPSRHGEPEGAAVSESLAERTVEFESKLVPLLGHQSPLVAAYALLTLNRMGSRQIVALPPELLQRRDPLKVVTGCFAATIELGSFARRIADSIWHDVPPAFLNDWNATFQSSQEILLLAATCPICGQDGLRRYFVGTPGIRANGGEWQWCVSCHAFAHYSAFVPEWWECDLIVDDAELTPFPTAIEQAINRQNGQDS